MGHQAEPRTFGHARTLTVLAGQHAGGERVEGQQAQSLGAQRRDQFLFRLAHQQAVFVLRRDEARGADLLGQPVGIDRLPARQVAGADRPHLAGAHQIVHRPQHLFHVRVGVQRVQLVEVDAVGLQPAQAVLERLHDIAARRRHHPARRCFQRQAEFRGQHDIVASRPEDRAERLLRAAGAIGIGRVEQRDAEVERLVDDRPRVSGRHARAEIVAAEADQRDLDARIAQLPILHGAPLPLSHRDAGLFDIMPAPARRCANCRSTPTPEEGRRWISH